MDLSLNEATTGPLASNLRVVAVENLSRLGVQVLLGRDVLDRCLLFYNGPEHQLTLALTSPT